MREQILNIKEKLDAGRKAAEENPHHLSFVKLTVAAMGGSMISGEILQLLKPDTILHQDYDLPPTIENDSTLICISWSGNTEEVLSSYFAGLKLGLPMLVITCGGKLGELAKQNNTPLILLPQANIVPRLGTPYMLGALLETVGLGKELDLELSPETFEAQGQALAEKIQNKTPLIYSLQYFSLLARTWKVLFNENDKIEAMYNTFPGLTHNELAGLNRDDKDNYHVILLRDSGSDPRENKNMDVTIAILDEIGYNYSIVNLSGKTLLEKVLNSYTLALWTSYYLAQLLNVNPEDTSTIERFKKLRSDS